MRLGLYTTPKWCWGFNLGTCLVPHGWNPVSSQYAASDGWSAWPNIPELLASPFLTPPSSLHTHPIYLLEWAGPRTVCGRNLHCFVPWISRSTYCWVDCDVNSGGEICMSVAWRRVVRIRVLVSCSHRWTVNWSRFSLIALDVIDVRQVLLKPYWVKTYVSCWKPYAFK